MSAPKKHVVFDVIGTCVTYDTVIEALDTRLGDRLREQCITPGHLVNTWFEAAEREYTNLSILGRYATFDAVFRSLFYRVLWLAGIKKPRAFASSDDLEHVMAGYSQLRGRFGFWECFQILRGAGFTVWGFTIGDAEQVRGYLTRGVGVEFPAEYLISCDGLGVGKPAPEAYKHVLQRLGGGEAWFAAAHMWDVSSAKSTGFVSALPFSLTRYTFWEA